MSTFLRFHTHAAAACAAITLGAGCAGMFASEGRVVRETDDFTGRTTVQIQDMRIPADNGQLVELTFIARPGQSFALLSTHTYSTTGWRYLRCSQLHVVADGHPVPTGDVRHDGTVAGGGSVYEDLTTTVPAPGIVRMSQASQARIRLCTDVVTLDGRHLARVRQFAAEMAR